MERTGLVVVEEKTILETVANPTLVKTAFGFDPQQLTPLRRANRRRSTRRANR